MRDEMKKGSEVQVNYKSDRMQIAPGMDGIRLETSSAASCTISLYGGQVLSYVPPMGEEVLFSGAKTTYAVGKAIRAGVPLVFPQFGKGTLPSHGFARTSLWEVLDTDTASAEPSVTLGLRSTEEIGAMWPHSFECRYTITLTPHLETTMTVRNVGSKSFEFYLALHTYFAVSDISSVSITGLKDARCIDFLKERTETTEERERVTIAEWTDRVYCNASDQIEILDPTKSRRITIEKRELSDAVVWNPWIEGSTSIGDLAPDDFTRFVCVESGAVAAPITLAPGESHTSSQTISSHSLK